MIEILKYLEGVKTYLTVNGFATTSVVERIKLILRWCKANNIEPTTMTFENICTFLEPYKDSPGTKNTYLAALKVLHKYFVNAELTNGELLRRLTTIKHSKVYLKEIDYFTIEEIDKIIRKTIQFGFLDVKCSEEKLKALIYFMFYTGLRKSQILELKRSDFNLSDCEVNVKAKKNKVVYLALYTAKTKELLEKYFRSEDEINNAFNLTKDKLNNIFKLLAANTYNEKRFHCHLLRHSFCNMLAEKGIDVTVAQRLMGHRSIRSTLRYYHPKMQAIKNIYRKRIG